MENKKPDWLLGVTGLVGIILFFYAMMVFFKYVSIGEWISMESYITKSEWAKQLGLFIATMAGF